jgi:hypothetical protein
MAPVQIDSMIVGATGAFAVISSVPVVIAPGDSAMLAVRFAPTVPGTLRDTLKLYTGDQTLVIVLNGESGTVGSVRSGTITTGAMSISLLTVVPNPISGLADVSFSIDGTGRLPVSLSIVDQRGAVVAMLFDGIVEAGAGRQEHLRFDVGELASGEYYLVLKGGGKSVVRKLVVMR